MAEKYYDMSPYCYCADNPVAYVDPSGEDAKVVVKRKEIIIKSKVIIYGDKASPKIAAQIHHRINTAWNDANKTSVDGKSVRFDVKVKYMKSKPENNVFDGMTNVVKVIDDNERAGISRSREGTMSVSSAAHEFGHIIGLMDRYDTVNEDGMIYCKPQEGYEGTIMAEASGFGVVVPEDVESAIKLCVPEDCSKGIYLINYEKSQLYKKKNEDKE